MTVKKSRENEVKFSVKNDSTKTISSQLYHTTPGLQSVQFLKQAYIFNDKAGVVRIRQERLLDSIDNDKKVLKSIHPAENSFILTIKGSKQFKDGRVEVERTLTEEEFLSLFTITYSNTISKYRFNVEVDLSTGVKGILSVDVFKDQNEGLVIAELEFEGEAVPDIINPPVWLGSITNDPKLYNSNLLTHPFEKWTIEERAEYLVN